MYCEKCGADNLETALHCIQCGTSLIPNFNNDGHKTIELPSNQKTETSLPARKIWTNREDNLFGLYLLGSGVFLFSIGNTFNGGFELTVKYLALPLAIIFILFSYVRGRRLSGNEKFKAWLFNGLLIYPMILVMSWPYLLAFNAIAAGDKVVAITGAITDKTIAGTKSPAYVVSVTNPETGRISRIAVSQKDYERITIGDSYQFCFYVGRLGLPFFWKFSGQPAC